MNSFMRLLALFFILYFVVDDSLINMTKESICLDDDLQEFPETNVQHMYFWFSLLIFGRFLASFLRFLLSVFLCENGEFETGRYLLSGESFESGY